MKKPLMRSLKSACSALFAMPIARPLSAARPTERPAPADPPATWRLPTTRSAPSRIRASIFGRMVSSCCRSASITATTGAEEASMPSMQAPARPRRLTRRRQRTRESSRAISLARRAVPSGELSSTTIISQATPASAASTRPISSRKLALSLNVGITRVSSTKADAFGRTFFSGATSASCIAPDSPASRCAAKIRRSTSGLNATGTGREIWRLDACMDRIPLIIPPLAAFRAPRARPAPGKRPSGACWR